MLWEKDFCIKIEEANCEAELALESTERRIIWNLETVCRFCEVLAEPQTQAPFIHMYDKDSRAQLDAKSSGHVPPSLFKLIADRMNDESFTPESYVNDELYSTFAVSLNLSKEACMSCDVTPEHIKEKLNDMRVKLMKMVVRFEASGNGEGNLKPEYLDTWEPRELGRPKFGKFDRDVYDSDHRQTYLGKLGEENLYFWHTLDTSD